MRLYYLPPLIPIVALVLMPFLPFVNTDALWLGLPRMLVWGGVWCALLTPALALSDRMMPHAAKDPVDDDLATADQAPRAGKEENR